MTTYGPYTFEAGANGDVATGGPGNTGFESVSITGGTMVISTEQAHGGTRSLKMVATTTSGLVCTSKTGLSSTACRIDEWIYVSVAASAEISIMSWLNGSSRMCNLGIDAAGHLIFRDGANAVQFTSTGVIPTGQWVNVRGFVTQNATTGTLRVGAFNSAGTAIANTDSGLLTGKNTGASPYTVTRTGAKCATGTQTLTAYFDDELFNDAATAFIDTTPPNLVVEDLGVLHVYRLTGSTAGQGGTLAFDSGADPDAVAIATGVFGWAPESADQTATMTVTESPSGGIDSETVTVPASAGGVGAGQIQYFDGTNVVTL